MASEFVKILDHQAWGKLVKAWAKREAPAPRTLKGLKEAAGNALDIPASVTGLRIVRLKESELTITLPTKGMIDRAETELRKAPEYPLPGFYKAFFKGSSIDDREMHACRIGEYSINNCM